MAKESAKTEAIRRYSQIQAWLVCFVASLFFFYEIVQLTVFNTISDDITATFALTTLQLSHLSASYLYACAIFLLPAGLLFDRVSSKTLLIITSGMCTLGTWILASIIDFKIAILARSLTGIGDAFAFLGCMRLASGWFPANKIALVMGLTVTVAMLGGIVSQAPFSLLVKELGWQQAMFVDALVGVIITVLILIIVKDAPVNKAFFNPNAQAKSFPFWYSLKQASIKCQNWFGGFYTGMMNLPVMMLGALWGNLYLVQARGFSETEAGNITSLIFFGIIIGAPLMGWLSDKMSSRKKPMILSSILIFIITLIILYLPVPTIVLSLLFLMMGVFSGGQVLTYPIISESNPSNLESTSLGLVAVIVNLVGGGAQILFGWLINLKWNGLLKNGVPVHTFGQYQFAMMMVPLAFFLSILAAFFLKDSHLAGSPKLKAEGAVSVDKVP